MATADGRQTQRNGKNFCDISVEHYIENVPIAIRKLDADEAARAFPRRRGMDLIEYTDALRELRAGDAVAVGLNGVSSRALKRRLSPAAKQLGYRMARAREAGQGEVYLRVAQVPIDGTIWLDQGYTGPGRTWIEEHLGWSVDIVQHPAVRRSGLLGRPDPDCPYGVRLEYVRLPAQRGFRGALPRRWVVERTSAWLCHSRRFSGDYERLCATSEALIYVAMDRLMLRRLART